MSSAAPRRLYLYLRFLPQAAALTAAAVGALALFGWFFDVAALKGGLPGWALMKANTALGFVLCGAALWASQATTEARIWRAIGQLCAAIVLLLGLLTLGEYLSGLDFGIDRLLVREITKPGEIQPRMAVSAAISLSAVGAALLLLGARKEGGISGIHALLLVPFVAAGSALIGYGYDLEEFLRVKLDYAPMPLPTAALFLLLAFGIASARSDYPFRRFIASESAAGILVRRLLPAVVVFTLAIGLLIERGYHAGIFGAVFALALFAAMSVAGLSNLVLWSARTFDRADVQRKRAEKELRASEERYRTLFEQMDEGFCVAEMIYDANGKPVDYRFVEVNPAFEKHTGLHDALGRTIREMVPDHDEYWFQIYGKVAQTGEAIRFENPALAMHRYYDVFAFRIGGADRRNVGILFTDITARKRSETQLRERVKELQAFFYLSELAARRDYPLESLCQDLVNILPQSWQYPKITCARIVIGSREYRTQNFGVAEWTQVSPITTLGTILGKVEIGYLEQRPDEDEGPFLKEERQLIDAISERLGQIVDLKRAEEALRFHAGQYATLLATTTDGYWRYKPDGRLLEVNDAYCQMSGYTREELLSMSIPQIEAVESPEQVARHIQLVLEKGFDRFESRHRRKNGETWDVEISVSYWRQAGELLLFARDITGRKRAEQALRASEELFRALATATSEGMLIHENGRIVEINQRLENMLGRGRAEVIGAQVLDFVAPAWRDMVRNRVQVPEDTRVEFAFFRPDGSEVQVSGLAHPCMYQGRPMRVAAYRDITLEKRAEEAMRSVGLYNRSLIEVSLDPLVTISPDGKIADVNEATIQATGVPRSLLIGSDFSNYFTEPEKARAGYQEVFAKGFVTDYPLSLRHVSGRVTEVLYNASIYRNAKGEVAGVFAAARDVTERRKLERELEHQAHIDLLTDLNNRRHFMELAEQERARARRHGETLSLLMMDLDNFKAVNDKYGHEAGDAVLQKFGEICRHAFRGIDIVGRLGGEEFAALLPETSLDRAMEVAKRLRLGVESTALVLEDGSVVHFTVSIGVGSFGTEDDNLATVLKRADAALYRAKNLGRNRVCSESEGMDDKAG